MTQQISDELRAELRDRRRNGEPVADIVAATGVAQSTVYKLTRGVAPGRRRRRRSSREARASAINFGYSPPAEVVRSRRRSAAPKDRDAKTGHSIQNDRSGGTDVPLSASRSEHEAPPESEWADSNPEVQAAASPPTLLQGQRAVINWWPVAPSDEPGSRLMLGGVVQFIDEDTVVRNQTMSVGRVALRGVVFEFTEVEGRDEPEQEHYRDS